MPSWAWFIGNLSFATDQSMVTGIIIAVVIPTGVTSVIWVAMSKGNVELTLSILLIDMILSPIIVPLSLALFVGRNIEINVQSIMVGLFFMIVIPYILGILANYIIKGPSKDKLKKFLTPVSKIGILVVVMINGADIAPYLREINLELIRIASVVLFIACSGYLFAWLIGKVLKLKFEDLAALVFSSGMRNIASGIVIATSFFSPKVAVPVVFVMIFQQLLASIFASLLSKVVRNKNNKENRTIEEQYITRNLEHKNN